LRRGKTRTRIFLRRVKLDGISEDSCESQKIQCESERF